MATRYSINTERVYEHAVAFSAARLVDALWPRGVSKDKANVDKWLRDVAPSDKLRRWFGHDTAKWNEFKNRYRKELSSGKQKDALQELAGKAKKQPLVLVYAAKDTEHNNAAVVHEVLDDLLRAK